MRKSLRVDIVDALEDLLEVVLGDSLRERSRVGHVVKELAARDHFLYDVRDLDLLAVLLDHRSVLLELKVLYHVLKIKRSRRVNLLLEQLECLGIELWVVQAENLERVLLTLLRCSKLDLGREAGA